MKIAKITLLLLLICFIDTFAQEYDSIYVNRDGVTIYKQSLSEIDSISFINHSLKPLCDWMSYDKRFSLYNEALKLTGYAQFINESESEDEKFDPDLKKWKISTRTVPEEYPVSRKYGFTIIAPSDSALAEFKECPACPDGIKSIPDLEKTAKYYYSQVFPGYDDIKDFKSKENYLNMFIAYHCLDRSLLSSRFIKDYDTPNQFKKYDMWEYIETLLTNTFIEIHLNRNFSTGQANLGLINSMSDPTKAVMFTRNTDLPNGGSTNGYYHEITKPVIYSKEFISDVSSKRLRLDIASFYPELASNNMRGNNPLGLTGEIGKTHEYIIPSGYLGKMMLSEDTKCTYLGACGAYEDYEGDLFNFEGKYDITIETPPIPTGKYELRISLHPINYNGKALYYFDDICCSDTVDLTFNAVSPEIGWELPGSNINDGSGLINDKLLRSRGLMKGPDTYYCPDHYYGYNASNARYSPFSLRKIIGSFVFSETKKHKLRVVLIEAVNPVKTYLQMDYIEFMPVNLIESEGID
jgi:hypothetical protein